VGRLVVRVTTALTVMLLVALGSWSCSQASYSGKIESITVGMESTPVNSLIYIAEDQKLFAANGLNVTIKEYASGLAATNGMMNGEVDIATAAEFVIVGKALAKESVVTLGSIDRFRHIHLIGRKDRGFDSVSDLKGKRIGVPLKTAAEFYLGRFLDLNRMSVGQVSLVDVSPAKSVDALVNGDVDAVVTWQPNVRAIEDRLGGEIVEWRPQGEQPTYCAAISTSKWASEHPDLAKRFLASLVQAEKYNASHPNEARAIVQKKLNYDDAYVAAIWPEHQLLVSLDQALVVAMEDQARWMMNNKLTDEKSMPDFLGNIYVDGLKTVAPASVNIIN